jgi:hypothetical protein
MPKSFQLHRASLSGRAQQPEWLVFMARGQRMRIREEQTKENVPQQQKQPWLFGEKGS